jgi:hypothetical protein
MNQVICNKGDIVCYPCKHLEPHDPSYIPVGKISDGQLCTQWAQCKNGNIIKTVCCVREKSKAMTDYTLTDEQKHG